MKLLFSKLHALAERHPRATQTAYIVITVAAAVLSLALLSAMALSPSSAPAAAPPPPPPTAEQPIGQLSLGGAPASFAPAVPEAPAGQSSVSVRLNEADAATLLRDAMADVLPAEELTVRFLDGDEVHLQGNIRRDALGALFAGEYQTVEQLMVLFAPESVAFDMAFRVALDPSGMLRLEPQRVAVQSIDVAAFIPTRLSEYAGDALTGAVPDGMRITALAVADGALSFTVEPARV